MGFSWSESCCTNINVFVKNIVKKMVKKYFKRPVLLIHTFYVFVGFKNINESNAENKYWDSKQ